MTPAINIVKRVKIDFQIHEYEHDSKSTSYGEEAASKMGVDSKQVFKTLVFCTDSKGFGAAVVPVSHQLDLKRIAKALGVKKAAMADKTEVPRVTGYVLGGVSPIGQKKKLPTIIDASAKAFDTIRVSAGRRGLQIELSPTDLCALTNGRFQSIGK
jgi:Cys-tRNA(Pro)/Cys-tRNA(Cys) deacylase